MNGFFFFVSFLRGLVVVVKLGINLVLNLMSFKKLWIFEGVWGWFVFVIVLIFFFVGLMLCLFSKRFMNIILVIWKVYFLVFKVSCFLLRCCNILCKFLLCFLVFWLWMIRLFVMFDIFCRFVIDWVMICWYFFGVVFILKFKCL